MPQYIVAVQVRGSTSNVRSKVPLYMPKFRCPHIWTQSPEHGDPRSWHAAIYVVCLKLLILDQKGHKMFYVSRKLMNLMLQLQIMTVSLLEEIVLSLPTVETWLSAMKEHSILPCLLQSAQIRLEVFNSINMYKAKQLPKCTLFSYHCVLDGDFNHLMLMWSDWNTI